MPVPSRTRAALTLAPPALLATAAMLLGWGIDDLEGFFANPSRTAVIAVILCEFAAGTLWRIELNPFRKGRRQGRGWPIVAGMFAIPLVCAAVAFCDRRAIFVSPDSFGIRWIGVGAFAAGGTIRLFALYELGRQYSAFLTVQPEHELIRSGIYRHIRHSFYLGGLLNLPGTLLAFRSPMSAIIFAISVAFVVNRIGREEQLLIEEFPEAYREYRQGSWCLLPPLY
jgi:protein-S-isoprenylcysteine O-methyltransferase Ste14